MDNKDYTNACFVQEARIMSEGAGCFLFPSREVEGIAHSKIYLPPHKPVRNVEKLLFMCNAHVFLLLRRRKSSKFTCQFGSRHAEIRMERILQPPGTRGTLLSTRDPNPFPPFIPPTLSSSMMECTKTSKLSLFFLTRYWIFPYENKYQ